MVAIEVYLLFYHSVCHSPSLSVGMEEEDSRQSLNNQLQEVEADYIAGMVSLCCHVELVSARVSVTAIQILYCWLYYTGELTDKGYRKRKSMITLRMELIEGGSLSLLACWPFTHDHTSSAVYMFKSNNISCIPAHTCTHDRLKT